MKLPKEYLHPEAHPYEDSLKLSEVKISKIVSDGTEAAKQILEAFKTFISNERGFINISAGLNDESKNNLMSGYMRKHEKLVWMHSVFPG